MRTLSNITLRLSITERCQLSCSYCNPDGRKCASAPLLTPAQLLEVVASLHRSFTVAKVRFTGGEPLLVRELPDMIGDVIAMGVPDVGVTTNAQLLAGKVGALWDAGLRRINVSCDSLDAETFRCLTGGRLERTLEGIRAARERGMRPIKLNMVVMRGRNDHEVAAVLDYALRNGLELRFLELMPIGLTPEQFEQLYVSSDEIRRELAGAYRLDALPVQCGSTASRFVVEGRNGLQGHVGFISPQSHPFCGSCRRLRLTSQGELIGCLAAQEPISVLPALGQISDEEIAHLAVRAFRGKNAPDRYIEMAPMAAIGG